MTEVISIRYKSCGKNYYFSPEGLQINAGDMVVVETAKGLELAECTKGNRMVEDTSIVQPLRPVIRIATAQDLKNAEDNKKRESEALVICRERVEAHGLDMKLVAAEISFDGSKTLFYFTSDGRVDFRELVKDLAGVFHNRIELRQIGVRDEAKMIGGIGICGRPYCCGVFLDDFAPVSTKMAKVQNLSLNPTKISGSCGRLMCCLRYEEDTYEELLKDVPKNGAFVETPDGYGIVTGIALLKQNIKVHLDNDAQDAERTYPNEAVAVIPGGRPKDGEPYPKVLNYKPEAVDKLPETLEKDVWSSPSLFGEMPADIDDQSDERSAAEDVPQQTGKQPGRHTRKGSRSYDKRETGADDSRSAVSAEPDPFSTIEGNAADAVPEKENASETHEKRGYDRYGRRRHGKGMHNGGKENDFDRSSAGAGNAPSGGNDPTQSRSVEKPRGKAKANGKDRHPEAKPQGNASVSNRAQENNSETAKNDSTRENRSPRSGNRHHSHHGESRPNDSNAPKREKKDSKPKEAAGEVAGGSGTSSTRKPHKNYHHRYYGNKKKSGGNAGEAKQ